MFVDVLVLLDVPVRRQPVDDKVLLERLDGKLRKQCLDAEVHEQHVDDNVLLYLGVVDMVEHSLDNHVVEGSLVDLRGK